MTKLGTVRLQLGATSWRLSKRVLFSTALTLYAGIAPSNAAWATAPAVDIYREIEIVHPAVVDPFQNGGRSLNGGPHFAAGAWSFRNLIEQLAPAPTASQPDPISDYMRRLTEPWLSGVALANGESLPPRDLAESVLLSQFSRLDASGRRVFDLWLAPFELIAIANRIDLHTANGSDAGELRFIFQMTRADGSAMPGTLIIEYGVPTNEWSVATWAAKWHELGSYEVGSTTYLGKLEALTTRVTNRSPSSPRLIDIRTNEKAFDSQGRWQLREFRPSAGTIAPSVTGNSPRQSLNGSALLGSFIQATPALARDDTTFTRILMPETVIGPGGGAVAFLGGAGSVGTAFKWKVPAEDSSGPVQTQESSVAVDNFGMLTCNGCHNDNKTSTDIEFYHVSPLIAPGRDGRARLSKFLTVGDASKPNRRPADLARRVSELQLLLDAP